LPFLGFSFFLQKLQCQNNFVMKVSVNLLFVIIAVPDCALCPEWTSGSGRDWMLKDPKEKIEYFTKSIPINRRICRCNIITAEWQKMI